ncbi:MAG: sulfurtransferase complex subunit TusB [Aestuariibacter sp.]
MLHIISQKLNNETINRLLEMTEDQDGFVLIGDGIYGYQSLAQLKHYSALQNNVYYLKEDARLRGFTKKLLSHLQAISYDELVDLTLTYDKSLTW